MLVRVKHVAASRTRGARLSVGSKNMLPWIGGYYSADTPSGETLNLLDPMHGYPTRSVACPIQAFALRKPLEKDTSKSSFGMKYKIRC